MIETSPVVGVKRFTDKKGNRYLSQRELVALGEGLRRAETEGENPSALAILKLLVFTGNVPSVSHRISGCRRKFSSAVHRRAARLKSLAQFAPYRSLSRGRPFELQVAGVRHCVLSGQHLPITQRCCRVDLDAAPKGLNIVFTGYRDCRWRLPNRSLGHCHRTRCRARASPDLDAIR